MLDMFPLLMWTPLLSGKLLVYGNLIDSSMSAFGAFSAAGFCQ
jgi:hypothetical protein